MLKKNFAPFCRAGFRLNTIFVKEIAMKAVNASQMQRLDREAIEDYGIAGLILMENAGTGVFEAIQRHYPSELKKGTLIVAGPGNNGGDGFVVARKLHQKGYPLEVWILSSREKFKGDALVNLKIIEKLDLTIRYILDEDVPSANKELNGFGLIIDAIFGTGLKRPVEGRFKAIIDAINEAQIATASVDIPSGLSADTGLPLGTAVKADLTITMALPKIGHILSPGAFYTGELEIVDIGIPVKAIKDADIKGELLDKDTIKELIKERPPWGHKGTFGHAVIVAGSRGKTGAAALAAHGALRAGSGLVTVASPKCAQDTISKIIPPEIMTLWLSDAAQTGEVSEKARDELMEFLEKKKSLVLGPGIGLSLASKELQKWLITECRLPMVIDADALTTLSEDLSILKEKKAPRVLTPHPGEMARLMGCSTSEVQENRLHMACSLSKDTDSIVVLKGARTIIAEPSGRFSVNPTGNSGMGQGGMGDTLSGIIGGLLAQGYAPYDAARIGVYVHGLCADILKKVKGPYGFTATEMCEILPTVWKQLVGC